MKSEIKNGDINMNNDYKAFAEWVANEILDYEVDDAFTEVCCRKLYKL